MTHDDHPPRAILDLVDSMRELEQRAALQYRPVVDDIVRSDSRDAPHNLYTSSAELARAARDKGVADFSDPAPWYFRTIGGWIDSFRRSGLRLVE